MARPLTVSGVKAAQKAHWKKYLPGLYKEYKEEGILDKRAEQRAKSAVHEYQQMVNAGLQPNMSRSYVMREMVLTIPPGENDD